MYHFKERWPAFRLLLFYYSSEVVWMGNPRAKATAIGMDDITHQRAIKQLKRHKPVSSPYEKTALGVFNAHLHEFHPDQHPCSASVAILRQS